MSRAQQARPGSRERPRLMISRLVLENFKSYAGVREIGPLHKRFSAIVGPNGSGKSNVIDALLFVFGRRAKKLRLAKVSELIHRSSAYIDLESARVSVYFQEIIDEGYGDDDFEVVPRSEFVISRMALKNNSSKYQIDERNSTFAEVTELLLSHGVDLDNNRFLILQGEVEQISMMKPKGQTAHEEGLLEYLEDIIGSNKYVEKIEEVSKEVDEQNERRAEKLTRARASEKERDNLSDAKIEAEEYLEQERLIRKKKNVLYQTCIQESRTNAEEIKSKHEALRERLQHEQEKLRNHSQTLHELEKRHSRSVAEYELITKELRRVEEEFNSYERRHIKSDEDLKHLAQQVKKLATIIAKEQTKSETLQQSIHEIESSIPAKEEILKTQVAKLQEAELKLQDILDSLQGETAALREALEEKQAQLAPEQTQLQVLLSRVHQIETERALLLDPHQKAVKRLATAESKLEELLNDEVPKSKALEDACAQRDEHTQRMTTLEQHVDSLKADEAALLTELRDTVTAAEEAKAALASDPPRSNVLEKVMEAAQPRGCLQDAGVFGRLGDLGRVPARYDMAVSTACTNLDVIVCDNTEGAKSCINFLREGKVGRATFVALDKIQNFGPKMDNIPSVPRGSQRLFDLIDTDPRYRGAFYMGLRDTLVCDDLDTAVKVAYEGNKCVWRVVTLDGGLIDITGTMSGGGTSVKKGGMKTGSREASSVTVEQIQELENRVTLYEGRLCECRARIANAQQELRGLKQAVDIVCDNIERLKLDLKELPRMKKELQRQISELKTQKNVSEVDQRTLAAQEHALQETQKAIAEKRVTVDAVEEKVRELQSAILEVGGPRLKLQQSRLDKANAAADDTRTQLSTCTVQLKTSKRNFEKAIAAVQKARKEMDKCESDIAKIEAEVARMDESALEVKGAYESAKVDADAKKRESESSAHEYEQLKAQVNKIKEVEVDIKNQLEEYEKGIKENKIKQDHWQQLLAAVRQSHEVDAQEYLSYMRDMIGSRAQRTLESDDGQGVGETKGEERRDEQEEIVGIEPLIDLHEEELSAVDKEDIKHEINLLEQQRDRLRANVNMGALEEYRRKDREYNARLKALEEVTAARDEARTRFDDLRRKRLDEFMCGFGEITLKLKEMYQMITLGGDAELELVDSLDPFSEGIVFSVRPPKKSWKHISNLSGGEKTLSSLALVFALHYYKPTPLYVMDEIDAALDFKNVSIVANYIKERTRDAQFVIISLRNNMFELADRLVGIYKTQDVTKSVTINPKLFDEGKIDEIHESKSVKQTKTARTSALQDRTNSENDQSKPDVFDA